MLSLVKQNKKTIFFFIVLLLLPIIAPLFITTVKVLFNLGVHFGTIARYISEGICCK